jgi:transcriptional regulator with XRE-family HTH domain
MFAQKIRELRLSRNLSEAALDEIFGLMRGTFANWEHGFDDYYLLTRDVDPASLNLQYEEVQAVRWAALEEILEMIDDGRFIPYEKGLIELLFFQRNHRGAHTRKDTTGA